MGVSSRPFAICFIKCTHSAALGRFFLVCVSSRPFAIFFIKCTHSAALGFFFCLSALFQSVRLVETLCYVLLKSVLTLKRNGGFGVRIRSDLKCAFCRDAFVCFFQNVCSLPRIMRKIESSVLTLHNLR